MTYRALNVQEQGDLARSREILSKIDFCLSITGDQAALTTVAPGLVDNIQDSLLRARYSVSTMMCDLGDTSGVVRDAPQQVIRRRP